MARGRAELAALEMEDPTMTSLESRHASDAQASFGTWSSTAAAVQDGSAAPGRRPAPRAARRALARRGA